MTFAFLVSFLITSPDVFGVFLKFTDVPEMYPIFCDEVFSLLLFSSGFCFSTSFSFMLSVLTHPAFAPIFT